MLLRIYLSENKDDYRRTMNIRPFDYNSADDYLALETIDRAVFPQDFETAAEQRHEIENRADYRRQHFLLEVDGRPVGHGRYLEQYWSSEKDDWYLWVAVHPAYQGQGLGKQLYNEVMDALDTYNPASLLTYVREDYPRSVRFLEDHGFTCKLRELSSELDVTQFDESGFRNVEQTVAAAGVKLYSLTELAEIDADWEQKTWALRWLIRQDVPGVGEKKQIPFEQWRKQELEAPNIERDGYIVAVDAAGKYIGLSYVYTSEGIPDKLWTGLTGVDRDWRRKGIATALKLRIIAFAKAYGATAIETDNEEHNPMYALNVKLGFRSLPAWLTYQKIVRQT